MTNKATRKESQSMDRKIGKQADKPDQTLPKVTDFDESFEEYTPKELEYLDRYKVFTENTMEDEDLYEIFTKHHFSDIKIRQELEEYMKLIKKKGDEYGWTKIENGKKMKPIVPKLKTTHNKNKNYKKKQIENTEPVEVQQEITYDTNYQYPTRGRNPYRGKSYRGGMSYNTGDSNRYYKNYSTYKYNKNYNYNNYKQYPNYTNYYNEDAFFEQELGGERKEKFHVRVVELDDNVVIPFDNKTSHIKEESVEQVHQPVTKSKPTHVEKVSTPSYEDESIIPSNIRSNINNIIDEPEVITKEVKPTQMKAESPVKKPVEQFVINSYSTTFGTTNTNNTKNIPVDNKSTSSGTSNTNTSRPFDNKKPVTQPLNTTKPQTQNQPRKQENTNPGFPEYNNQMPNGFMPYPFFYYPQMQGMNYDPNQMTNMPMYNPMYYMQQPTGEMDDFMKGKKTNFSQQPQTQNMNEMGTQFTNPTGTGFPPVSSYFYYNSMPPYNNMGMNPMMMGGYPMMNMQNQPENYNNSTYENMKNQKSLNNDEESNYFAGRNFYNKN